MPKAVVLLSGGLDSTTCLAQAKADGCTCYALSFDYGQRHRVELKAAQTIATQYGVSQHIVVPLALDAMVASALTDPQATIPAANISHDADIPTTYVPARNTTFLAIALGWAETLAADFIYIGVSAVDYSGYPDCRPEYIQAFQQLANLATKQGIAGSPIVIKTPLIDLNKADTIRLGLKLGVDYSKTISCYQADGLGRACGSCDSCSLRRQGFAMAAVNDPTPYHSAHST